MDNETNPHEELYRRFRKSLTEPVAERFFDEDELADIYDYAGDLDDDYVQLEVLLCGARLYPESHQLAERKALLYLDTTDDESNTRTHAAENFLADNPDASSILFDIARLEVNPPADAPSALEFLINQYDTFDDEEIIRFVDLAIDLGCYDWLVANIDRIAEKVPFKPSFYYEVAREADDRGDDSTLIRLADALIELEPFTATYWMMLLRGQTRSGKSDEARQTFDYAKALAGESSDSIFALCDIAYHYAPELLGELEEPVRNLARQNPDEFSYTDGLCAIYSKLNYNEATIRKTLAEFLDRHPENEAALQQYLNLVPKDIIRRIDAYFGATDAPAAKFDYEDLVRTLCTRGEFATAQEVIDRFAKPEYENDPVQFALLTEILFRVGNYQRVVDLCGRQRETLEYLFHDPMRGSGMVYIYAVALIKIGFYDKAYAEVKEIQPFFESAIKVVPMPLRMAIRSLLTFIDKMERHSAAEKLYWENFDMLFINNF